MATRVITVFDGAGSASGSSSGISEATLNARLENYVTIATHNDLKNETDDLKEQVEENTARLEFPVYN